MAKKVPSKVSVVLKLAKAGPLRTRDLDRKGIPRTYLRRLADRGAIERVARGLYRVADANLTEQATLAEVAKRHPESTLCLLSALQVHGLTTQLPHEVWLLIDRKDRAPSGKRPKLHVVRASGISLSHGVTTKSMDGVAVRITNPPRPSPTASDTGVILDWMSRSKRCENICGRGLARLMRCSRRRKRIV
ncbi:MAG: type IV toxin-antitoxin system AbiEi family antitoxin domain-containing protein [Phycisphaerae bacterium]|nr:type IV toxin-antitoxin system AbiEi family antitoxin domain-containing protein [Phycisphaerae bacterium]